ncbi:MAG: PD40 domain-containing protein [Calditrichaeota bacterium]|nr:PD40 domain-containing protein [Calditrichota bacterium]
MLKSCYFWLLLLVGQAMLGQSAIQLQGQALEVLSSQTEDLEGFLFKPQFSPYPSQVFSFVRQVEAADESRYLYIYDLAAKSLIEVRTVTPNTGLTAPVEDSLYQTVVFNEHLDWRPVLDEQERQWFAFVSNGTENNRDIYIGFAGGSNYIRLTNNPAVDTAPKWSPDGNSIAFISRRSGNGDIYLVADVDKIISEVNRDPARFRLVQLTDTPLEERHLDWNPDPASQLLAYSRLVRFPGRQVATFQIRIMDLSRAPLDREYAVTNDPLTNYTRPRWDPQSGSRLLYTGQGILQEAEANLYVSEMARDANGRIANKVLEDYRTEVFTGVRLTNSPALWLAGGEAVLCQKDSVEADYPIYSVNVRKWLEKEERGVNEAADLNAQFPNISEFDARKNNLIFIDQEENGSRIYLAQVYGDDILPYKLPSYALEATRARTLAQEAPAEPPVVTGGGGGNGKYLVGGGAVAATAAVVAYFLLKGNGNGNGDIQTIPIGMPPSAPGSGN